MSCSSNLKSCCSARASKKVAWSRLSRTPSLKLKSLLQENTSSELMVLCSALRTSVSVSMLTLLVLRSTAPWRPRTAQPRIRMRRFYGRRRTEDRTASSEWSKIRYCPRHSHETEFFRPFQDVSPRYRRYTDYPDEA